MNVTVGDLMTSPVMTVSKHQTAGHVRKMMAEHRVSAVPVIGPTSEPLGIVTASDLLDPHAEGAPASELMSTPALTVRAGDGPHVAARIMRNHHTHHVVVVEQHEVVGILSAYDLVGLVQEHRYTAKAGPTPARRAPTRQ